MNSTAKEKTLLFGGFLSNICVCGLVVDTKVGLLKTSKTVFAHSCMTHAKMHRGSMSNSRCTCNLKKKILLQI